MAADLPAPDLSPLAWGEDGLPRSRLYGDVYFSSDDGLAESRAVFLAGCGLPDAWAGRRRFTVGELGFGTGLNIAALLTLWNETRPEGGRLHIFSIEAHPLSAQDAERALSRWPQVGEAAAALVDRWPGRARGMHRIDLPAFDAVLDLAVMDAAEALAGWRGAADAWFLDGFSPAANPAMWGEDLMRRLAERSAPGVRAATFTVAGSVRRALAAAGFEVEKRPGFGRKRERLEARLPSPAVPASPPRRIAVVGAGIAGAALARAFRAEGCEVQVFGTGAGASGNPAALVTPRLDAGLGPPARLFAEAFRRAAWLYREIPETLIARGVLQLESSERDAPRFSTIAASDLFEPGTMVPLDPEAATARLGESSPGALLMAEALVIEPAAVLAGWLGETIQASIERLEPMDGGWRLHAAGGAVFEAEVVCLAAGMASAALADLPLQPVRGQASWTAGGPLPFAAAFGGYAIPTRDGVLFGATHDRDDSDEAVRPEDNARNLALLTKGLPGLAGRLAGAPLQARASIRATTPDRLPLAGALSAGLYVLTGLGSRGFATAPLLAEHVAALALGAASPLMDELAALVGPGRFAARASRRAGRAARQ